MTAVVDHLAGAVASAFAADGVDSILLKGRSIAASLYAPGEVRAYIDADLLVAPATAGDATRVLRRLGFRYLRRDLSDGVGVLAETWLGPADRPAVDLHYTLPLVTASPDAVWRSLRDETEFLSVGGSRCRVLAPSALCFHIALHAVWHGSRASETWDDLARALRTFDRDVWRGAALLATRLGALIPFTVAVRTEPSGGALASELGLPRTGRRFLALAASDHRGALALDRLAQRRGIAAKAGLARAMLLPSPSFMRLSSRLANRGALGLAAAYAWRAGVFSWRAAAGIARSAWGNRA